MTQIAGFEIADHGHAVLDIKAIDPPADMKHAVTELQGEGFVEAKAALDVDEAARARVVPVVLEKIDELAAEALALLSPHRGAEERILAHEGVELPVGEGDRPLFPLGESRLAVAESHAVRAREVLGERVKQPAIGQIVAASRRPRPDRIAETEPALEEKSVRAGEEHLEARGGDRDLGAGAGEWQDLGVEAEDPVERVDLAGVVAEGDDAHQVEGAGPIPRGWRATHAARDLRSCHAATGTPASRRRKAWRACPGGR